MRHLWESLKKILGCIGDFQSRFLLVLFYCFLFLPLALLVNPFQDPLRLRTSNLMTAWRKRPPAPEGLDQARRQF